VVLISIGEFLVLFGCVAFQIYNIKSMFEGIQRPILFIQSWYWILLLLNCSCVARRTL